MTNKVVHEEPDLSGVDEPLASIVRLCLKKDPQERPTPERLLQLLASRRERREFQAAERSRNQSHNRRRRTVASILVVFVALAAGTATVISNTTGTDGKSTSAGTPTATPTTLIERAAALRPRGWGTWNTDLPRDPKHASDYGNLVCQPAMGNLVCADTRALYLLDGRTGRVVWQREPLWSVATVGVSARTGILIINVPHGGPDPDSDLLGLRVKDGKTQWTLPSHGSPKAVLGEPNSSCTVLASGSAMLAIDPADGTACTVPQPPGTMPIAASGDNVLFVHDKGDDSNIGTLYRVNVRTGKTARTGRIPLPLTPPEIVPGQPEEASASYLLHTTSLDTRPVRYTSLVHVDNRTGTATTVTLPGNLTGRAVMVQDNLIVLRADGQMTAVNTRQGQISWTKALTWPAIQEGSGPVAAGSTVLAP
ncbi:outer membrane protein assembly factor BamB family protein [Streptomyces sp. NPDC001970]